VTDTESACALVAAVFGIPASAITATVLTGGVTNKLYRCCCTKAAAEGSGVPAVVLVRQFGEGSETIVDRDRELRTILALCPSGEGPTVYARFANGMAYEFFGAWVGEGRVFYYYYYFFFFFRNSHF
jgi:hypothetical protein